jgi:hypothetical protein
MIVYIIFCNRGRATGMGGVGINSPCFLPYETQASGLRPVKILPNA